MLYIYIYIYTYIYIYVYTYHGRLVHCFAKDQYPQAPET